MTPDERSLVEDLFRKLDATQVPVEDAEADALIRRTLAERPALAYRLMQHAVLQDIALPGAAGIEPGTGQNVGDWLARMLVVISWQGGRIPQAGSTAPQRAMSDSRTTAIGITTVSITVASMTATGPEASPVRNRYREGTGRMRHMRPPE